MRRGVAKRHGGWEGGGRVPPLLRPSDNGPAGRPKMASSGRVTDSDGARSRSPPSPAARDRRRVSGGEGAPPHGRWDTRRAGRGLAAMTTTGARQWCCATTGQRVPWRTLTRTAARSGGGPRRFSPPPAAASTSPPPKPANQPAKLPPLPQPRYWFSVHTLPVDRRHAPPRRCANPV